MIFTPDSDEFGFRYLESTYRAEVGLRIARTPLLPGDPSTYVAMSKYTEYYLRKFHSSTGVQTSNQIDKPALGVPKELIGSHSDGKTEVLLMGSMLNPLVADTFKPVHLTPGCISTIVAFSKCASHESSNIFSNRLFGRSKAIKSNANSLDFRQPKNSINRNTSGFIEKIVTGDTYLKKLNNASSVLISAHGRILNVVVLDENPREIDIDPPCLRLTLKSGVITCMSTFKYTTDTGEQNLDILVAFATGDILWLNPFRMKYSRWNKNGKIKNELVTSIVWSKSGMFAYVGFSDGEVLVFDRNLEDPETNYIPNTQKRKEHMKIFKSMLTEEAVHRNPIAHYKFTKKPITCMTVHPLYSNVLVFTSDDEFTRVFDLLTERIIDIIPSYYGGVLVCTFTPDGRYLLAGGEDDLVAVFEFNLLNIFSSATERSTLKLVTRLQGAKSWIKSIVVEQPSTNPSMNYIIATGGDDGYIRFYDFQPRNLRKVKKHQVHAGMANHLNSPKFQMQKAFSPLGADSGLESKRKTISNRSSNTLTSLTSGNPKMSLFEMINKGPSSSSLQQLQTFQQQSNVQIKLTEGPLLSSAFSSDRESTKLDLMRANTLFKGKYTLPSEILLFDSKNTVPYVHTTPGMDAVPKALPFCEKNVNLGCLGGLYLGERHIWALLNTGDLIRWKKIED